MTRTSAGLLMYRRTHGGVEVLLAHPGGPFWATRDQGAWTLPKGEVEPGEDPLEAAIREFVEETGLRPEGPYQPLGHVTQRGGKRVQAWAVEGDCDPSRLVCSSIARIEWPPRSGRCLEIPEVDRVEFFDLESARHAINPAQAELLDRLDTMLNGS